MADMPEKEHRVYSFVYWILKTFINIENLTSKYRKSDKGKNV